MSSTATGLLSENAAESYLKKQKMKIIARNWRRKACEIDIIAEKAGVICFVEVKFRSNEHQGSGLEYITSKKIQQMKFAAEIWCQENLWTGDWRLLAAAVEANGERMQVKEVVEVF